MPIAASQQRRSQDVPDALTTMEEDRYIVQVFVGALSDHYEALSIEAVKGTTAEEIVFCISDKLGIPSPGDFELAEVVGNSIGQECKERRLGPGEHPVGLMLLWPKVGERRLGQDQVDDAGHPPSGLVTEEDAHDFQEYRFYLREKLNDSLWTEHLALDPQLIRDYFYRFLYQPRDREYPDLCQLPDLNEETLLENLKARFHAGHIYTYVGSILIAVNPFKFHPIYNPKYVKLYQNRRLGELPPHIFAVADAAYHAMLRDRKPQCIVISGESGSGKTESTNFLLHHLTALSHKGSHGSGVEQTILSAGPVLEAFGNAKTSHNNNSSRFGKFIQVTYRENGQVQGAVVQKYLLEKSRICSQAKNERNYHVFYHLLAGASQEERENLHLQPPHTYRYLNQSDYHGLDPSDESYELSRLKQSMEMVGFSTETQRRVFAVLSAVLQIGNVEFQPKKSTYHHDESVNVKNPEVVRVIASLLKVREDVVHNALISKRARASGETLVINYRMPEAIAARDAMAKCLYGSLFDWIVLQLNHALLAKKDPLLSVRQGQHFAIGVLDIFGFEDFGHLNSFEQLCINYANERLQDYFNQHVFKYEQEEYQKEGLHWVNIQFVDNVGCLQLFGNKPNGLLCILDDQCNFPGATNETLLQKFNTVHKDHDYYEIPQKREAAFIIRHYAGKVKYQVAEFREKNLDLMRGEMVGVLKSSQVSLVRELVGADPVAVYRWSILRAFVHAYLAFVDAGKRYRVESGKLAKNRTKPFNDTVLRQMATVSSVNLMVYRILKGRSFKPRSRLQKSFKTLESVKALAGRMAPEKCLKAGTGHGVKKQPMTVSNQFQHSLNSLMETLNQANPFFVRCIKSNVFKIPNQFDDENVQRQLRYTGMLETVRIRQAGFNVRLTFDEFIHLYRILLPNGLLSSTADVVDFLNSMNLNPEHYQVGHTKIFLRESEKAKLDHRLHQAIMASIVTIQRWFRATLQRRHFLTIREAVIRIQSYVRMLVAQRLAMNLRVRHLAATFIQKVWRGYTVRRWCQGFRCSVVHFQARVRGNNARRAFATMKAQAQHREHHRKARLSGDAHSTQNTDEAFLSKESSQEDLEDARDDFHSEESSGIQEDSEAESIPDAQIALEASPPLTPISTGQPESPVFVAAEIHRELQKGKPPPAMDLKEHEGFLKKKLTGKLSGPGKEREGDKRSIGTASTSSGSSVSSASVRIGSIEEIIKADPTRREESPHKGAFQKAKKHLKTFITGKKNEKEESESDSEQTLVSSTSRSTLTSLSTMNSVDRETEKEKDREARREERIRLIAERSRIRSRNNSMTDELGTSFHYLPSPLTSANTPLERRASKDSNRSASRESSLRGSRDSLVDRSSHSPMGGVGVGGLRDRTSTLSSSRRDSYVSATVSTNPYTSANEVLSRSPPFRAQRVGSLDYTNTAIVTPSASSSSTSSRNSGPGRHRLNRTAKLYNGEACGLCSKPLHAFFAQGYKCSDCLQVFHAKCVQNGPLSFIPCVPPQVQDNPEASSAALNRTRSFSKSEQTRKGSRDRDKFVEADSTGAAVVAGAVATPQMSLPGNQGKWALTGTSQYNDSQQKVVTDAAELQKLDEFIARKIHQLGGDGRGADKVFLAALKEFKSSLISTYSLGLASATPTPIALSYRDLITQFDKILESASKENAAFPITLGVNAFRGFMNEFVNQHQQKGEDRERERGKAKKRRKERWKKSEKGRSRNAKQGKTEEPVRYLGHEFLPLNSVKTIPTACEVCSSFTWLREKGLVCQLCKLACHKKCYERVTAECGGAQESNGHHESAVQVAHAHRNDDMRRLSSSSDAFLFGVPLEKLVPGALSSCRVPPLIDRLMSTIELVGMYTEGLYRKSGVTSRVQQLKRSLEEEAKAQAKGDTAYSGIDLKEQPIHALSAVLKSFLREMPQPLLTFDRYDDFLRAADMADPKERVSTLLGLVQDLPRAHFDLLERLIFHLTRVALNEKFTRMNANSLAIVFAPCILRTCRVQQAQDSLMSVGKQTLCVEILLSEQLKRVSGKLADINNLDAACLSYDSRLCALRASKMYPFGKSNEALHSSSTSKDSSLASTTDSHSSASAMAAMRDLKESEEALLAQHIKDIREEKAALAATLPSLARTASDEDLLSTDGDVDDGDSQGGSGDDISTRSSQTVTCVATTPAIKHASKDKLVIQVHGQRPAPLSKRSSNNAYSEWEQRLSAGRQAIEEEARVWQQKENSFEEGSKRYLRRQRQVPSLKPASFDRLKPCIPYIDDDVRDNDGSVTSSYQAMDVELDEDAIMV